MTRRDPGTSRLPTRRRRGAAVAGLAGLLLLAACGGMGGGASGPVVSPTGIVYEPGTPPADTRYSQTAALYLRSGRLDRALELATEGIEADPGNPIHHFLAGMAAVRLGRYAEADGHFIEAERIYPAYELDIEPEREAAWAESLNAGIDAYVEEDAAGAIEAWEGATAIYDLRPEAHRNLASLLVAEGRYEDATAVYERQMEGLAKRPATRILTHEEVEERGELLRRTEAALAQLLLVTGRFAEAEPLLRSRLERDPANPQVRSDLAAAVAGQGRGEEAAEIYGSLLSETDLEAEQLLQLGIAVFRAGDFHEAAEAFRRLTGLRPDSRDAWFNYANALFAAEAWEALLPASARLLELDPLSEHAALILARARLEIGDEAAARRTLEEIDGAPVRVGDLRMDPAARETRVQGTVTGHRAEAETPVRLRFTFYGREGLVGTETVTVQAPPPGASRPFELSIGSRAEGYRYELLR